jgi:hypothetical protein
MPCLNSEFDRDYRCMLYLLHREVRIYLLEEVRIQPPHVHHLHFLDFNEKKNSALPLFCRHLIAIALFYFLSTMAANPAQLVPTVAQQLQPPIAQQPYPQQCRRAARPPTVQYSSAAEVFGHLRLRDNKVAIVSHFHQWRLAHTL